MYIIIYLTYNIVYLHLQSVTIGSYYYTYLAYVTIKKVIRYIGPRGCPPPSPPSSTKETQIV